MIDATTDAMIDGFSHAFSLAQATPEPGSILSVWEMVERGGWTMIPIGLCSLAALTIVVERALLLRKERVAPRALRAALAQSRGDDRRARAACATDQSPLARLIESASRGESREDRVRRAAEAGDRAMARLRRRMRQLSAIPQAATMLGLLGTVIGMIRTFTVVAGAQDALGKPERLAQGIYEAWTATAAGLVVAIPTLIAYHVLLARLDAAAAELDEAVRDWLDGPAESPAPEPSIAASSVAAAT